MATVTANWFVGNINTTNSLVTSGNVTANNFIGSDPNVNLIAGSYTWAFNDAGNLVLPSNTFAVNYANGVQVSLGGSYSNADVANYLASNANVTITVGVSNITTQGNISGNYFIGNGALLTGVVTSSYSNANVANYLPTYSGNITAGNIAVTGNVTANWFVGNINTTNSLVTSGNITANNFIGSDPNVGLVAGNYTWLFDNAGNVTLPSNTFAVNYANGTAVSLGGTYSNADVANYLPTYNGNALFSNITVSRDAVILGNLRVEGNTTYINVSDLIVEDKDIIVAANANATMTDLNGAGLQIGNRSAGGNITFFYNSTSNVMTLSHGANIANVLNVAGNITATGNVNTGNLVGSGTNVEIVGGSYTWTFNGSGNLVLPGNSFAVNYANGTQVALAGSYSNTNVKAYLGNFDGNIIPSANVTYDLGSNSNRWNDLYLNNSTIYIGAQEITANADSTIFSGNISVGNLVGTGDNVDIKAGAYTWRFDNAGNLTLPANTSAINYANGATVPVGYGNASVAAYLGSNANLTILSQGNITGNYFIGNGALLTGVVTSSYSNANVANYLPTYTGNIAAGNVTATGNVQGAYILGNGALLTGLPATYGNSNVAAYLASNANVTLAIGTGNITTQGNLAVGNLIGSGDNVDLKAGSYTWRFDSTGNLTLPANSTAIYYANGTQVPVGYGNANVATYLASNSAVTILTTANITTAANISGAYLLGNGALLTGLPATYGNSNVAAYLAAYNGNALFSNITVSQDAVVLGNLRVEGNTTYINVSDLIVEDKDIIVAANASATMTDLNGAGLQIGNRTAGGNITFFYNSTSNVMSLSHGANIANVLNVSGNVSATGNVSGNWFVGNINTTNSLVTSGNVTANNFLGSGSNVTLESDSYSWIFDNAGNLTLPGNTFAVNYANGTQISLGGSYSNSIVANYLASNANLTISVGTGNITTQGNITGNYFIGNGALLTGVVTSSYSNANVANYLPTYTGNISAGNITATGNVTANGFIGSNVNTRIISSSYIWTFNNTGNLVLPGNTFGVTYANGTTVSLGGTYSNADVANYLPTYTGNITAGNVIATGNVIGNWFVGNVNTTNSLVTSGNVTANNFVGSGNNVTLASDSYTWTFDNTGNFILPGNNTAIYYANGTQVPVGYGNANVATYLASNANVTVSVGTGNITTQGNISGNYFIGNGALLTGIVTSSYSNANVANYLASNANLTVSVGTGNITTQGNINSRALYLGSQRDVIYQVSGNITLAGGALDNNANISIRANTAMANSYVLSLPSDTPNAGDVLSVKNFGSWSAVGNVANLIWSAPASTYGNTNVAAYLQAYNGNALFSNVTVSRDVLILGNLRVEGNTTEINVSNIFLEDKDIIVAANASATLSDLNGAGLQIGNRTAGGNVTFFYNSISNVMSLSHGANIANVLNVDGNIVATGNVTGNYILGNGALLTGLATYGNSNVAAYLASNANVTVSVGTGNITTQGNLTAGNFIGSGSNVRLESENYAWQFDNAGNLTLPGNTFSVNYANGAQVSLGGSYSNADVANYLASNANLTISVGTGNITTQGNVSGNYFIGNGALLTGIATGSYSNANVANYLASNANLTISVGTGNITTQGNLAVGNLIGSGDNVEITAGVYTWTLDNTGNLTLPGNTTAINYANGTPVPVGYGNSNVAAYLASNANVTVSVGTGNITTQGNVSGNYFIGNGALLTGVVTSSYSNANVANYLPTYSGNVSAGNLNLTGNIVDTGAIFVITGASGNVVLAPNGTSRIIATTSGANVIGNLDVAGNVNANGATLTGNLSVGNLIGSGDNVEITAGAYTWTLDNTGNLTLPGNSTAIYYANGTQVPVGYGNANVATYLASNAAVTILTTANITTAANISGAYILGNGAFLSGLPATYSNSNVAAYLAAYNGNALFSNITVSQDAVILGNLRVEGNTTYINVSDLIVEDKDIIVAANASATLTDLNGAGLQIGNRTAGGNITFFYNSTSNVMSLSHGANIANILNVAGNVTATGNVNTGNLVGSGTNVEIVSGAYTWLFDGAGNLTGTGNVSAGNFVGTSGNTSIVTAGYTWTFNDAGNLVLPGNVFGVTYANGVQVSLGGSYSNADVANYLASNANVTVLVGTGNITTQGNISGNYFIGNGALLTGVVTSSYSNANVANYLPTYTGNITAGNITTTGNVIGNWFVGNVSTTNSLVTSGNVTANNFVGSSGNTSIVTAGYTWVFNDTGNFVLPGNSFSVNYANGAQVSLGGSYSNADVKAYLGNFDGNIIPSANVTYNLGSNSNRWNDLYLNNSTIYIGAQEITANADATIFSGNISANYILGNGALLTGVASSYGNANVADYLASNANINLAIGTGNITTAGNISVGSIQGANANTTIVANVYSWTFDDTGNLTLPGNSTAIYLANGTQVPLGYNNASVADYMGSNANVTLSIGTGNITTQGNIKSRTLYLGSHQDVSYQAYGNITLSGGSADNNSNVSIVANGAMTTSYVLKLPADTPNAGDVLTVKNFGSQLLFGNVANLIWSAPAGSYTNANVANYLVTYNANALFSNVTVSQDAVILGNLRVEGNTTYINVSDLIVEDKDIIVAANASATLTDLNGAGLQIGNRSAGGNITFFYNSTSNVMTLSHGANIANVLNVAGNITANSLIGVGTNVELVGGSYTWTFNGSGNLVLPGNAFSVNYANGAQVSLGGSYSNAEAASYLASNANVTILTGVANITTQGNVAAGYFLGNATFAEGVSNTYFGNVSPSSPAQGDIWINSDTAVQLIYFVDANGGQWAEMAAATSISSDSDYTDSNVTALLASLGANTISSSANITTSANISAGYILGNGSQLTGLDFTNYTNSNVANYLVSYNANALFSNVTVSRDMVIIGNLRVEGNTTEINVSNIFLEDKDIIVAANASATLSDLNGAGLQIGNITAGGNITFFYDSTSNVMSLSHGANIANVLNVAGNISAANITATGNITGNTNGFTIGYRDVPQVSWSNATMALADASKHYYTSTGGVTLTVPSNANVAFPIGATIAFYNRSSANCTIAPQASVNIFVVGNSTITPTANRTITSNGGGTLTKVDTNTWMLSAANVV